jgi:hypothetical protein
VLYNIKNNEHGVSVRDYRMIMHMNLTKKHLSKHAGIFVCEGMPLHDKKFIKESSVKVIDFMAGKFGKSEETFYLNEKDSPMFNSLEALVIHYHSKFK